MGALATRCGERTAIQLAPGQLHERVGASLRRDPIVVGRWASQRVDGRAKNRAGFRIKQSVQGESAVQPLGEVEASASVQGVGIGKRALAIEGVPDALSDQPYMGQCVNSSHERDVAAGCGLGAARSRVVPVALGVLCSTARRAPQEDTHE